MALRWEEQEGDCGKNGVSKKKSSNVRQERWDPITYCLNRTWPFTLRKDTESLRVLTRRRQKWLTFLKESFLLEYCKQRTRVKRAAAVIQRRWCRLKPVGLMKTAQSLDRLWRKDWQDFLVGQMCVRGREARITPSFGLRNWKDRGSCYLLK